MQDPLPLNWNRSQYVVVPATMLRPGDNEIEIQQRAYGGSGAGSRRCASAPRRNCAPSGRAAVFWQNDLVRLLAACTGAIGLFMLGVCWAAVRTRPTFWFGCASLLWTAFSLDYFAAFSPLPAEPVGALHRGGAGASAASSCSCSCCATAAGASRCWRR